MICEIRPSTVLSKMYIIILALVPSGLEFNLVLNIQLQDRCTKICVRFSWSSLQ